MDMFDEIDKIRKELPKFKDTLGDVTRLELNNYQIVSVVTMMVCFCLGIILGNVFPACESASSLYSSECTITEFNFSLTLIFWGISFLVCMFFYGMGHIISLLTSINEKLSK